MDRPPQDAGRWPPEREPSPAVTVPGLVAQHVLDAELAALLWIMVEGNVPLVAVAAEPDDAPRTLLEAFLDLLPPVAQRLDLRGAGETFDWLGDAAALGWEVPEPALALPAARPAPPETTYLVAGEPAADDPGALSGIAVRTLVRALQRGYGLAATIRADSLQQVLVRLGAPPASLEPDELRRLGIVLVMRRLAPGPAGEADLAGWRVMACHYVRPLERDVAGHLQRRPPAILATLDPARDALEHFEWGVTAELAMRVGLARDEFEYEHLQRSRLIAALVASGRTSREVLETLRARRSGPRTGGDA